MTDYLRALVLGVIEGLTEFLPVSSTGHMLIANPLIGVDETSPRWRVFLFIVQLAAILAVVLYFWRDLWRLTFRGPRDWRRHLVPKLLIAFAPTLVLGLLLNDAMEALESRPAAVAWALIVGAFLMLWIDRRFRRRHAMSIEDVTPAQAFLIGLLQVLAMWPGVSRSGATIMGGMVLGLTPAVAAEFTFYLAIPTMLGAGAYKLFKYHQDLQPNDAGTLLIGCLAAFATALLVIAGFMNFVRRRRFTPFAIYRILLGVAVLALYYLTDLMSR